MGEPGREWVFPVEHSVVTGNHLPSPNVLSERWLKAAITLRQGTPGLRIAAARELCCADRQAGFRGRNSPLSCAFSSNWRKKMPDDLAKTAPEDQSRISLSEPYEVQFWADKFNVSKERLSEAVRKVGNSASAVEKELRG